MHNKEVLRKFIAIILSLFILLFAPTASFAQEGPTDSGVARPDIFPLPNPEPGFLGQDHSYSVTFRGNGEAVVSLKVVLSNKAEQPLKNISLRIPKVEPREIFVYQVLKEPTCIRYLTDNSCAETQEPDYYGYYWSKARYQKAESTYSGDTLEISLPQAIAANKSGSFFVYFRAMGYAKKNLFAAYKFNFETLKVEDDIRNLTVGISTDSDLVLRGAQGEVNYRFEDAAVSLRAVGGGAASESSAIDTFYSQIGYGTLVKIASSLAPLESYRVSSSFADSRIKLYGKEIAIGLGIVLLVVIGVAAFIRWVLLKTRRIEAASTGIDSKALLLSSGVSFGSALLVSGYTFLAVVAATYLTRSISYDMQAPLMIFIVVISFAVYALFLFAPGIYLGVKKGIGWGIITVFLTIIWLVILLGLGLLLFVLLKGPQGYPGPILPLGGEVRQY
ncbi:hypothetical protein A2115_00850 [Candidatus Woesebacteria bacterium GWA1_41_8]|uniref:Yip1 domain-containing protein n=1 Tax=Candidatus Woesebacteria bacterium GWA1_41_8 TaxID=1802471 RepID=A0A1F7WI66_9BACT|nr:MAG: hypothetical protein A2115_00850 [Candidatus Woesebacteria bacterium GWA1_41_8]